MTYVEAIHVKQNDCLYDLPLQCQDADGNGESIAGYATIKLMVYQTGESSCKLETTENISVTDETTGKISYEVQDGDFDEAGSYRVEIEVTFDSGKVLTYPNFRIEVDAEAPESA